MAVKIDETLEDADRILSVWDDNKTFTLGDVTQASLKTLRDDLATQDAQVRDKETEMAGLKKTREETAKAVRAVATRARSGFRAVYGPDSKQYKQAGGTPTSERQPRKRKTDEAPK